MEKSILMIHFIFSILLLFALSSETENIHYEYYLTTGQSNMVGNQFSIDKNNHRGFEVITPNSIGWELAELQSNAYPNNSVSFSIGNFLGHTTSNRIRIIHVARGSQPIEAWDIGGVMWNDIINAMNIAGNPKLNGIFFLQGEQNSDIANTGLCNNDSCYMLKLDELIDRFEDQEWFDNSKPFIDIELYDGINGDRNSAKNSFSKSNYYLVETSQEKAYDGVHYTGNSLINIGHEAAKLYLAKLIK